MNKAGLLLKRTFPAVAGAAAAALLLAGCGGASVNQVAAAGDSSAAPCGAVNVAMNAWVGYTANAAVYSYVAKNQLGCTVVQKDLNEQISWQVSAPARWTSSLKTGAMTIWPSNTPTRRSRRRRAHRKRRPHRLVCSTMDGREVPGHHRREEPEQVRFNVRHVRVGRKGAAPRRRPRVRHQRRGPGEEPEPGLQGGFSGSEAALIQSFRTAEQNKTPLLGYFYEPQWFLSEVPLKKVSLPAWTKGCDAEPEKVACDYPTYTLNKIISTKFAESGSPAAKLAKGFKWTNEDQNAVATDIQGGNDS